MSDVEYYWSDLKKCRRPLHQPALVDKAIKTANWQDRVHATVFLSTPPGFETEPDPAPMQRVWFCRALQALTRDEMLKLYDTLMATHRDCLETGGDFTSQIVRDHLPHLYPRAD
jgi:hypothetical protein